MAEWEICKSTRRNAKLALQLRLHYRLHTDLSLGGLPTAIRIDPIASKTGFIRPAGHLLSNLSLDRYRRNSKPLLARRGGRILRRALRIPVQSSLFGIASIGGSFPLVYEAGEARADNWGEQRG